MADAVDLSVIVVSWNTAKHLERCLSSVYEALNQRGAFEVIVVDNNSSDGSRDMVRARFPAAVLIENESNRGFGSAANQGAKRAGGEFLLFLNSDAELRDSGVFEIVGAMRSDRTIGVATGKMINDRGQHIASYYRFPRLSDLVKAFTVDRVIKIGRQTRGVLRGACTQLAELSVCDVDWVSGGYMLVRSILGDGGDIFDERIFMYFEDTLFCRRVWDAGYRVVFVNRGIVFHEQGASARQVRVQAARFSYESSQIYVGEAFGCKRLWWYETVNRFLWRFLALTFESIEKLGGGEHVRAKVALFRTLIAVPRMP